MVIDGIRWRCTRIGSRYFSLMTGGSLELDRLVCVFGNIVAAGRGIAAGIPQCRWIGPVGVIGMALQANLVLARHMRANDGSTGAAAAVTAFDDIADREVVRVKVVRSVYRLDAPVSA